MINQTSSDVEERRENIAGEKCQVANKLWVILQFIGENKLRLIFPMFCYILTGAANVGPEGITPPDRKRFQREMDEIAERIRDLEAKLVS